MFSKNLLEPEKLGFLCEKCYQMPLGACHFNKQNISTERKRQDIFLYLKMIRESFVTDL